MEYLHRAARHIADQGRGPDSHLMHVSTNELNALGRLHPSGKVPMNPRTGLPEAGWLDQILPMVVGLGATLATGGAAAPLVGAAASGLTKTAMTGDIGQGLMTGLLSYGAGSALNSLAAPAASAASGAGGAASSLGDAAAGLGDAAGGLSGAAGSSAGGLGGSLGNAAGSGAASTVGSAAAPQVSQFASLGGPSALNFGSGLPAPAAMPSVMGSSTGNLGGDLVTPTLGSSASGGANYASLAPSVNDMSLGEKLSAASANLQNDPGGTLSRTFIDNATRTTLPLGVGLMGSMGDQGASAPKEPSAKELRRRYPEQFPDPVRTRYQGPPAGYNTNNGYDFDFFPGMAAGGGVHGYYAKGGIADANPVAAAKANIAAEAKMALIDHHPNAKQALRRYADTFGEDALKHLTDTVSSMGGRIRGAGGGLDDLIPGTIEGRKDVRLADGEFVVPADVVSHLGDGSSDQGVRKLTEMMNRIRKDKTGTEKQAGHINDNKVLPA